MTDSTDLAARLAHVVGAALGADIAVADLHRLSGGASRETWSFDAVATDLTRPLILRRDPPGAPKSGMVLEARLLEVAGAGGVAVPEVVTASDDPEVLGTSFLVMERVEGETIPRKLLRDDEWADARTHLAADCGVALARLHAIDVAAVDGLEQVDPLEQWRAVLDGLGEPHPAFELGFRWLEAHRPAARPPAIVHGDFRTGNLLIGTDGLRAVLDWELTHAGDPMEDLGWFCVRSWRFGADHLQAGGFGTYDDLITAYEGAGGAPVDREALHWWETFGTLRWGIICIMQASAHLSGAVRSVELAAIGRRVCENEWDVLSCLDAAGWPGGDAVVESTSAEASAALPDLHGRPTAGELLEAVRLYIEHDVMGATDGRVRFHGRVAARALGIIEREIAAGSGPVEAHAARLAALGVADDGELAAAVRSGALDDRLVEVRDSVRASVLAKLQVANPAHIG
jgi:aminoglycoside phosphotransferase (APT) family kinase protein